MSVDTEAVTAFCTTCGSRLEHGECPMPHHNPGGSEADLPGRVSDMPRRFTTKVVVASLIVALVVLLAFNAVLLMRVSSLHGQLRALGRSDATARTAASSLDTRVTALGAAANGVASRVAALEAKAKSAPNPAAVAAKVRASVFVVETDFGLGSAWAVRSAGGSSTLVTNFHVISDTWNRGGRSVQVKQNDATWSGTIVQVDIPDDLALISTPEAFPTIARAHALPEIGDSVMVVGAPLGLDATVTSGIVSALRTQDGHQYLQFSAPISPGNSGGPVVDSRGLVVGIAVSKYVGDSAEGLSFAVPVAKLCSGLHVC